MAIAKYHYFFCNLANYLVILSIQDVDVLDNFHIDQVEIVNTYLFYRVSHMFWAAYKKCD